MNLLAKDLGIPRDLDAAIALLRTGRPRAVDVGEVNGAVFLINSVIGMPARMARHREGRRGRRLGPLGLLRLVLATLRHLGPYPRLRSTVTLGGRRERVRLRLLCVVNNDYAEAPAKSSNGNGSMAGGSRSTSLADCHRGASRGWPSASPPGPGAACRAWNGTRPRDWRSRRAVERYG